jgi:aspartate/methionine/tyrosine aminotransferase
MHPKSMRDFALEVYFSKWEFTARHNLAGSDGENMTLSELLALASSEDRNAFENARLGYTETWGAPALRAEIARTYDTVRAEDVLCFAGAEEAIYTAMHVLLKPGDHAIVIAPNYQSAETIPLSLCEVSAVALDIDRAWALDIEKLEEQLRPNTKLISINFPNNPTGKIIPHATFNAIVDLCRSRDIWLFSDECYRLLERDPRVRLPQAVDVYEKGISLNVMSKAYGLAGLRIGWIACKDRALLAGLERFKHFLSICNSAPSEALALIALKSREHIIKKNLQVIRDNLEVLDGFFDEFRQLFDWRVPEGGCVAFIRYKGRDGVEDFTARMVEECGVLLLPSSVFRSELAPVPNDCVRVGFGRSHIPQGVAVMREWLAARGSS